MWYWYRHAGKNLHPDPAPKYFYPDPRPWIFVSKKSWFLKKTFEIFKKQENLLAKERLTCRWRCWRWSSWQRRTAAAVVAVAGGCPCSSLWGWRRSWAWGWRGWGSCCPHPRSHYGRAAPKNKSKDDNGSEGAEAAAAFVPAPTTGQLLLKTKAKTIMGVKGLRQMLPSSPLPLRDSCS